MSPFAGRPERDERFARVRRGIYADRAVMDAGDRDARYMLRVRAVHAMRPRAIFARESALAVHGVPYGLEPKLVYTVGTKKTAGTKAGVTNAQVALDPRDTTVMDELPVCTIAYALADFARRAEPVAAVAAIDHALHRNAVTKEQIVDALGRQSKRGRARASWAVAFADAAAESVGESWSRVRVHELGFEAPELQVWVTGPTGRQWRVDMRFARPGRRPVYGEFDGMQKYGELANRRGKSGADALAYEKLRDDDLLFTGDPAHWVWADALHPARLEKILEAYGVPRRDEQRPD